MHLWGSQCGCPHSLADSFQIHRLFYSRRCSFCQRWGNFWYCGFLGLRNLFIVPNRSGALGAKSCTAIRIQGEDSVASSNKGADQVGTGASWGLSSCKGQAGILSWTTMAVVFKFGSKVKGWTSLDSWIRYLSYRFLVRWGWRFQDNWVSGVFTSGTFVSHLNWVICTGITNPIGLAKETGWCSPRLQRVMVVPWALVAWIAPSAKALRFWIRVQAWFNWIP